MNQISNNKINNPKCGSCGCEDRFLHYLWNGEKCQKKCTSCVLYDNIKSFCHTCFQLIVDPDQEMLISCSKCFSYSHARCVSTNDKPFMCSICENPERIIFDFREYSKPKKDGGFSKLMDLQDARLLLTAAQIVQKLISEAHAESVRSAVIHATEAIMAKKKAREWLERFMKFEESNAGPSLLDYSPETSIETQKVPNEEE